MLNKFKFLLAALSLIPSACSHSQADSQKMNYRQEMRNFVIGMSRHAKAKNPNFLIIPQNGQELITTFGNKNDAVQEEYLRAIDGQAREDFFYGYPSENRKTPRDEHEWMKGPLVIAHDRGKGILVIDYTNKPDKKADSYASNDALGFISYVSPDRSMTEIPTPPHRSNDSAIHALTDAKNFIYTINSEKYETASSFIEALAKTTYDVVLIDAFFKDGNPFTKNQIERLKQKPNGQKRLVISYMSIGEAETYRYYWKSSWKNSKPEWIHRENPDWPGNYKVKYWNPEWQSIIYGESSSYLDRIIDQGFDGVYLDIIDAFFYFEEMK